MNRRFAIATIDRYLGVFEAFVRSGWKPVKLFTVPMRSELGNQQAVINYASENGALIQLSPVTAYDIGELRNQGCEALIVASYDWKIPDWQLHLKYAVNFHSSPLPQGRGAYPPVRAILEKRDHWAVTCHRLTSEIDKGDIVAAEKFPLQPDECHEKLDLKIQMAAKKLAVTVASRFSELWEQATPQEKGSYWPKHTLLDRTIYFQKPVENILRHIRAFGATESLANINGAWLIVKRAVGWAEAHNHRPGDVVHVFNRSLVVAAADGYVALLEHNLAPFHIVTEMQALLNIEANKFAAAIERTHDTVHHRLIDGDHSSHIGM